MRRAISCWWGSRRGCVRTWRAVDTASRIDEIGHLPARLGGDEFVVLLDGIDHPDDAAAVAERLLGQFSEPHTIAGHEVDLDREHRDRE